MVLDIIFGPLLRLPAWLSIIILSVLVSFIITIIQKYTTDQKFMKETREQLKKMQKEISEASKKNPKKALQLQSKAMELNSKYMMQSFKPMLFTMIPILIIFGWIMANYSVVGVMENNNITVDVLFNKGATGNVSIYSDDLLLNSSQSYVVNSDKVTFLFNGTTKGIYPVKLKYNNEEYFFDITVSEDGKTIGQKGVTKRANFLGFYYGSTNGFISDKSDIFGISLRLHKLRMFGNFNLGWWFFDKEDKYPGALFLYIIVSIISSMLIRKYMKVY